MRLSTTLARCHSIARTPVVGQLDQFDKLLEAARTGQVSYGLTGEQRYILYFLACETGLRRGELRSITPACIDLVNSCVFIKGENTKNKDDAVQFFTPETGRLLREYIKDKPDDMQLFPIHDKSAKMIQADCEAAGIELTNHNGTLNFHSLRHTCGSFLAVLGAQPKEVMEIMRHHDINLTMARYAHLLSGRKQAAVNLLRKGQEKKNEKLSA